VFELHLEDIDHLAVFALTDADDLIVGLEFPGPLGRASGDDAANGGDAVLLIEFGANSFVVQAEPDAEILEGAGEK
jgi:dihydroorotate dehydrogenase